MCSPSSRSKEKEDDRESKVVASSTNKQARLSFYPIPVDITTQKQVNRVKYGGIIMK